MELKKDKMQRKYKKAITALATLKEAIVDIDLVDELAMKFHKNKEKIYKTYRDSLIQRFEYTFDLTWKFLSDYLEQEGRMLAVKTPKTIFRESLKANILSEDQVRLAVDMVDHRNLTTHGYDEQLIEEISKSIPDYCLLLEHILHTTKIKD